MASCSRNTGKEPVMNSLEDVLCIAVGKDLKECKNNVVYALQSLVGKKMCILHVHEPAKKIPMMGTKFPASAMKEEEVRAYHEIERQDVHKVLDEFLVLCHQAGARAEKLYFESDRIEKGIVELISLNGIRRLVIGAAADRQYSRKMTKLKSRKAMYVHQKAPAFCQIQFICKGQLICTREAYPQEAYADVPSPSPSPQTQNIKGANQRLGRLVQLIGSKRDALSPDISERLSISESMSDAGRSWSRLEHSYSPSSSSGYICAASSRTEDDEYGLGLELCSQMKDDSPYSSPSNLLGFQQDGSFDDCLYIQLEQAITDVANAKREAFKETIRRGKAEKELGDALRRAQISETLYAEELKQRREIEEVLAREREELNYVKSQVNEMTEGLQIARNKELDLENQISESDLMVKELEQKIFSAIELLHIYKSNRDELERQHDEALKEVEKMRTRQAEASSEYTDQFFYEISFLDIAKATQNFNPSLEIGDGTHGSVYKGILCNTEVAIKVLHSHTLQSQREVDVLSKMRHPNIITLIGACPVASILVYDYSVNGSLEDRLVCRGNSSPLSWKTRIRIATELCSALTFLHSIRPYMIIHGDLKPKNILLDVNYVCKLVEFGSCHFLPHDEKSMYNEKLFCTAETKANHEYLDPEFLSSGKLTTKSDVYSFGIVLLRLLTGKSALRIIQEVQLAINNGNLKDMLDPLAGDWPFVQAEQLARLALRCCNLSSKNRPELESDVWRVLEPMRASCGGSLPLCLGFGEQQIHPPPYFICPIFQDVMQDPHVAADGFTYEAEALRGWLESGHDTSPMTNLKLEHRNLVPNRVLRSAIQEWLQQHQYVH